MASFPFTAASTRIKRWRIAERHGDVCWKLTRLSVDFEAGEVEEQWLRIPGADGGGSASDSRQEGGGGDDRQGEGGSASDSRQEGGGGDDRVKEEAVQPATRDKKEEAATKAVKPDTGEESDATLQHAAEPWAWTPP